MNECDVVVAREPSIVIIRAFVTEPSTVMRLIITVTMLCVCLPVAANEEEAPESPWSGKATLGYLATSGNTENTTLNTGAEVSYTSGKWVHTATAAAIEASENEVTTAEAYDLGWKSERNITEKDFLFGRADWRKDRFSGYDTQFSQTVGYGRRLLKTERHALNAELGVGARQSELVDGTDESETVFRGALDYTWKLNSTADFRQNFLVESGSENTYLESVSAISAKLLGDLALVASFTVKSNSDVPAGTEKTDRYTALSLEYTF